MNQFQRVSFLLLAGPVELILRAFAVKWTLDHDVVYESPEGWSLTAEDGMTYDSFSWAPNLRKEDGTRSDAAAVHDQGWITGKKDDGSGLTFTENNVSFRAVLDREGHPEWLKDLYSSGVSLPMMRKKWRETHGHE